jgi:hypothetical protein
MYRIVMTFANRCGTELKSNSIVLAASSPINVGQSLQMDQSSVPSLQNIFGTNELSYAVTHLLRVR